MRRTLSVEGRLELEHASGTVTLTGNGATLRAACPDGRSAARLIAATQGIRHRLGPALRQSGLTLALDCGEREVARIGARARPTFAGRLVGVPGLQLGWVGIGLGLRAWASRWTRRDAER